MVKRLVPDFSCNWKIEFFKFQKGKKGKKGKNKKKGKKGESGENEGDDENENNNGETDLKSQDQGPRAPAKGL